MVLGYIRDYGSAKRADINKLLWDKLSDSLDDKKKYYKIGNLLNSLKRTGKIESTTGNKQRVEWILSKSGK